MPTSPRTAAFRRWAIVTAALGFTTALLVAVYITELLDGRDSGWLMPRLMQLCILLSVVATTTGTARLMHEQSRANSDQNREDVMTAVSAVRREVLAMVKSVKDDTGEIPRITAQLTGADNVLAFEMGRKVERSNGHG